MLYDHAKRQAVDTLRENIEKLPEVSGSRDNALHFTVLLMTEIKLLRAEVADLKYEISVAK